MILVPKITELPHKLWHYMTNHDMKKTELNGVSQCNIPAQDFYA